MVCPIYACSSSVADNSTSTTTHDVCFIDPESDARYAFFVPVVLVLVANVLFFAAVLHVVVSAPVSRGAKRKMIPPRTARALKASLMFLPTLVRVPLTPFATERPCYAPHDTPREQRDVSHLDVMSVSLADW